MDPSCLEAHATPRPESGDGTSHTPPLPASTRVTRDGPGLSGDVVLGIQARTRNVRGKKSHPTVGVARFAQRFLTNFDP